VPATRRRRAALAATGAGALLALTACATGPRPKEAEAAAPASTTTPGQPVGDAGVDRVLSLLESGNGKELTAHYTVTRKLGDNAAEAVVVEDGPRTAVTVGDIRFLMDTSTRTCTLSAKTCQDGLHEQVPYGQYSVRATFYGGQPATALRVTYGRRQGLPTPSTALIAGMEAQCVDVPVGTGVEKYCAAPQGILASWDTAYVHVDLVSLTDTPDQTALAAPA
jgi:hypothetical protein